MEIERTTKKKLKLNGFGMDNNIDLLRIHSEMCLRPHDGIIVIHNFCAI